MWNLERTGLDTILTARANFLVNVNKSIVSLFQCSCWTGGNACRISTVKTLLFTEKPPYRFSLRLNKLDKCPGGGRKFWGILIGAGKFCLFRRALIPLLA